MIEQLSAYELIEKKRSDDLNSMGYLLKHKKSGANIFLLDNDDENKVFYIGFRTPPSDSTGVAHILEHSVLCGSQNFPVKDPFVELAKGSLNTFLNAMTYPDKTVYPVASCNDKDFANLMHVYLDAVFHPNIYKEPKIFKQEGWHYDLTSLEDELEINGVVYNEMKGAFSSPDDVLDREVFNTLFPDTAYGVESGGDPKNIPDLTYEQFIEFHQSFYHPSNSYIYLYGNMDFVERLTFLDEFYLTFFEQKHVDSEIKMQEPFDKVKNVRKEYPISEGESEKENTYFAYNTAFSKTLDRELYYAFQVLDYALCSAPGAPLKQALIDAGIGKEVYSVYENGILQPYFSIVAKGTDEERLQDFLRIIEEVLNNQVCLGINKKSLYAGISYFEFKYKEADFGNYPKGLMIGLNALDSWLYDIQNPYMYIEANELFKTLKKYVETGYFEHLIQTYLIDNTHKSICVIVPKIGLATKREQELKDRLAQLKANLSQNELVELIEETKNLEVYQESEDKKEDIEKLPLLSREDLGKEAQPFINELVEEKGLKILHHEIFTNQVSYIKFIFDTTCVCQDELRYIALLRMFLGYIDTKNYKYADLFHEVNIATGGISTQSNIYVDSKNDDQFKMTFETRVKTLYDNTKEAMELVQEILFSSDFSDTKRLYEILLEQRSRMQSSMTSAGHSLAAIRALSKLSQSAALQELMSGISFYQFLDDLCNHFDEKKEKLVQTMNRLREQLLNEKNLLVDYTGTKEGLSQLSENVSTVTKHLKDDEQKNYEYYFKNEETREAFKTSAQVQYVCAAGNFKQKGLDYSGALRVLKVILGYDYLWMNVRVKGGAYGCMNAFTKTGDCYFVSYRDPNLSKTFEVYQGAAEFIKNFSSDEKTMTKYIIGAISDLDTPLNPSAKGSRSLTAYLSNVSFADEQKVRDELLACNGAAIQSMYQYVMAIMESEIICVVGNEEEIDKEHSLFSKIQHLF